MLAGQRTGVELRGLNQRIVLRRGVDICADARDGAVSSLKPGDTEIGNLHDLLIGSEQKVLRLDIAVNDARFMRVRQTRANLLKKEHRAFKIERLSSRQRRKVSATQIL